MLGTLVFIFVCPEMLYASGVGNMQAMVPVTFNNWSFITAMFHDQFYTHLAPSRIFQSSNNYNSYCVNLYFSHPWVTEYIVWPKPYTGALFFVPSNTFADIFLGQTETILYEHNHQRIQEIVFWDFNGSMLSIVPQLIVLYEHYFLTSLPDVNDLKVEYWKILNWLLVNGSK